MSSISNVCKAAALTLLTTVVTAPAMAANISQYESGSAACSEFKLISGSDTIAGFKLKAKRGEAGDVFRYYSGVVKEYIYKNDILDAVGTEVALYGERNGQSTFWAFRVLSDKVESGKLWITPYEKSDFLGFRVVGLDRDTPNRDLPIQARIVDNYAPARTGQYVSVELTDTTTGQITIVGLGCY